MPVAVPVVGNTHATKNNGRKAPSLPVDPDSLVNDFKETDHPAFNKNNNFELRITHTESDVGAVALEGVTYTGGKKHETCGTENPREKFEKGEDFMGRDFHNRY